MISQRKLLFAELIISLLLSGSTGKNISRCCREDQQLDIDRNQCINYSRATLSTYTEEDNGATVSSEPLINCFNNGSQWLMIANDTNQLILNDDDFCSQEADGGGADELIFYCKRPTIVRKCCPLGMSMNRTLIGQCVPNVDGSVFFNATKYIDTNAYEIQANSSIQCEYDFNIYLPKMFVDNGFKVNGSRLVVKAAMYEVLRQTDYYCIDEATDSQNQREPIAVTCLSWRMYLLHYLLFGATAIFPYLHFISALLLLVTALIYCLLPTIRDNVQGYSMICFLLCMVIVQTEYGVILVLPFEPHTWCFSKVWISTYFRYASSCWITVMGYNIWTQLNNGPKKITRQQLLKRFGWCSLYAWGVPFILNMAVVIYIRMISGGRTVRLCWFGNPVVSHMLSTPNVVLVTANLVFFVPSALKVYGSLRFLKTSVSPVALSKIEKERITTIFRFFLLMEFYTIPRIIHEIVDNAKKASPELLIVSISLYVLIGPFMFYFFVCKKEVTKLLKQRFGNQAKPSISTSSSSGKTKTSRVFWRSRSYETSIPITPNTAITITDIKYESRCEDNAGFTPE